MVTLSILAGSLRWCVPLLSSFLPSFLPVIFHLSQFYWICPFKRVIIDDLCCCCCCWLCLFLYIVGKFITNFCNIRQCASVDRWKLNFVPFRMIMMLNHLPFGGNKYPSKITWYVCKKTIAAAAVLLMLLLLLLLHPLNKISSNLWFFNIIIHILLFS